MRRRVVGILALLAAALVLTHCEMGTGGLPGSTSSQAGIEAMPSAPPAALTVESSPTATSTPLPTRGPTATLVPTFPPAPTRTPRPTPVPGPTVDVEAIILTTTNEYRQEHGCPPVAIDSLLTLAAQAHAEDMAQNDFYAHVSPSGSTLATRLDAVGYRWSLVGENIAVGYRSGAKAVDDWMQSEHHRDNILNCNFKEMGVGYVFRRNDPGNETWHYYWVQVLGTEGQ